MSIFVQVMSKTISVYRQMLRKYLPQTERIKKLNELGLKNPQLYENEKLLYQTGYRIVEDIEQNLDSCTYGYYSYSGLGNFATHLKDFLKNYMIVDGKKIIHRAQKASNAIVEAIQLIAQPLDKLNEEIKRKLLILNTIIANYGSVEQHELHKTNLQNAMRRLQNTNVAFHRSILNDFLDKLQKARKAV